MNSLLRLSVDFDLQMGLPEWLINGREQVSVKDLSVFPSSFSSALPGVTVHSFLLIRTISSPDVPAKSTHLCFCIHGGPRVMTGAKTSLGQACEGVV